LADLPLLVALALLNGLQYRDGDRRVHSADDSPTSCINLVNFGAANLEIG